MKEHKYISIVGAKQHNLKSVDVDIEKNKLTVITGLSGSGKSSLAFDTIYAEGQRRYMESLSSYARQFLDMREKPEVESITGISPAIALDQRTISKNPRSTVGTATEIYDYMRLLFSRVGVPYSPATGKPIESQSVHKMIDRIMELPEGTSIYILSPILRGGRGEHRKRIIDSRKKGCKNFKIDGVVYNADSLPKLDPEKKHNIDAVLDKLIVSEENKTKIMKCAEFALKLSGGLMNVEILELPQ